MLPPLLPRHYIYLPDQCQAPPAEYGPATDNNRDNRATLYGQDVNTLGVTLLDRERLAVQSKTAQKGRPSVKVKK